jgi:putative oxidoreductase
MNAPSPSTPAAATPSIVGPLNALSGYAWPLVRIATGLMLVPHGAQKLFGWFGGHGLAGTGQFFESSLGLSPGLFWATVVALTEFFGGLALVLGLLTRPAALAATVLLAVAVTVHLPNGFFWTNGGYEYPLMWAILSLAILLRGGDAWSLDARLGLRL